jgi:thiol-disulfide isomerase/thioredoxin
VIRLIVLSSLISNLLIAQTDQIPAIELKLTDGTETSLEEIHHSGPVLIDFWALWCAPCLKAMRHLDDLQEKYREQGLTVLGINLDTERSRSKVRSYIRSKGYGFTVALDPSQESYRRLNGTAMPYTMLVDSTGKIVYRHSGYLPGDEKILETEIQSVLTSQEGL